MKRLFVPAALLGAVALVSLLLFWRGTDSSERYFTPPEGVNVTYFPAPREEGLPLIISATVDAGFMRPFLLAFQRHNPTVSLVYVQSRSGPFLKQALDSCHRYGMPADIYLSASIDQLMRLANENCAQSLPAFIGASAPGQAQWRNEVVAFTVEPAVFVFSKVYFEWVTQIE